MPPATTSRPDGAEFDDLLVLIPANLRDLSFALPGIAAGRLTRSANPAFFAVDDLERVRHHIRLVVDLTALTDSLQLSPPTVAPHVAKVPIHWKAPELASDLADAYMEMIDTQAHEIIGAIETIAFSDEPTLMHCTAGHDRTGVLAALLALSLGIDRKAIMADYLATSASIPYLSAAAQEAAGTSKPPHDYQYENFQCSANTIDSFVSRFTSRTPPAPLKPLFDSRSAIHKALRARLGTAFRAD